MEKVRDCIGMCVSSGQGGLWRGGWSGELVKKLLAGPCRAEGGVADFTGVTSVSHKHTFTQSPREKAPMMRWSRVGPNRGRRDSGPRVVKSDPVRHGR